MGKKTKQRNIRFPLEVLEIVEKSPLMNNRSFSAAIVEIVERFFKKKEESENDSKKH